MNDAASDDELLEAAILLAAQAHRGQRDKAGRPYILHPLRVMARMTSTRAMIAAVLHDVVEDTDWTLDRLREQGFPEDVVVAVDCLSRREGEPYDDLIKRAGSHPIARQVKIADLEENMDVRRLGEWAAENGERLGRYFRAWRSLIGDTTILR